MKNKFIKFLLVLTLILSSFVIVSCKKKETDNDESEETVDINDLSYRDAVGTNGIVTAGTQYASNAGLEVLKAGGNAFDAAAAVAWAISVTEPNAAGIGGGGSLVGYVASTGEVFQLGFNSRIASGCTVDKFDADTHLDQMKRGTMSVAIPGTVAGFTKLVETYGSGNVTLSDTLQPAIKLAEEGFALTDNLAGALYFDYWKGAEMTQTLEIYSTGKRAKRTGEMIYNPNQAKVLREIAAKGAEGFYTGWVAEAMVAATEDAGMITLADYEWMMNNGAEIVDPLYQTYTSTSTGTKYDVYTQTTPNSGGVIILETLNEIETYCNANGINLASLGYDSSEFVHLFSSAYQYASADRRAYVADTSINPLTGEAFNYLPINGLINKNYAYDRFTKVFNPNKAYLGLSSEDYGEAIGVNPWDYQASSKKTLGLEKYENEDGTGTTSFNVIDKDGNMCCVTFTNSSYWGSYVMPDGCGFMLNNSVTNFNWTDSINQFAPYKRAAGYVCPMLVLVDGAPYACIGAPGSEKIPSVQIEVFLNMVEFGMDVKDAVTLGRVFCNRVSTSDTEEMEEEGATYLTHKLMYLETYDYSQKTINELKAMGYTIHEYKTPGIAAVQASRVNYNSDGVKVNYEGCGDPRRGGKSLAY